MCGFSGAWGPGPGNQALRGPAVLICGHPDPPQLWVRQGLTLLTAVTLGSRT